MKNDHFERHLRKEAAMPAPGQYGSRIDAVTLQSVRSQQKRGGSARYSLLDNPDKMD